jgi:hypothetical protein
MGAARSIQGKSGFLTTSGRPRIATLEGRTFVVGRGRSVEVADFRAARVELDRQLAGEKTKAAAKKTAAKAVAVETATVAVAETGGALAPGARVRVEVEGKLLAGVVQEIGARSVSVLAEDGNFYRRAPSALSLESSLNQPKGSNP